MTRIRFTGDFLGRNQKMRLNCQARQERQEEKTLDLILAFLASLAVQSRLRILTEPLRTGQSWVISLACMVQAEPQYSRHENDPGVRTLHCINRLLGRVYHDLQVRTPCPLPRSGPAILVCNHISGLDPILVQAACPRLIRWMMAREYRDLKQLRWLYEWIGTIPVDRKGRDMAATRAALAALEDGYILGIFPEGKWSASGQLLPFQSGIALLAAKSKALVYPAYLDGTQRGKEMLTAVLRPQHSTLRFGNPISLKRSKSSGEGFNEATARVQAAVEELRQAELSCRKNERCAH
jgi:1-acyl-sn-glycerol-3-phosphate acyltransferase